MIPEKGNAATIRDDVTTKATDSETTVTFGAKIGANLAAGTYENVMLFTAYTRYTPQTLLDTVYMQDLTATICSNTTTPSASADLSDIPTAVLRDIRDGTYYTVRKLADGNCWMTEDLQLSDTLTTTDENGDTVLAARQLTSDNSDVTADFTMQTSDTSMPQDGWYNNNYHPYMTEVDGEYYYNFAMANAIQTNGATSVGTICPKNWTLPTYASDTSTNGSYDKLMNTYGSTYLSEFNDAWGTVYTGYIAGDGNTYTATLNNSGTRVDWWTKTAATGTTANALTMNSNGTYSISTSYSKLGGRKLRCYVSGN